MIERCFDKADRGESIWLPALRREFDGDPHSEKLIIRLVGAHYGMRDYSLSLPHAQNKKDETFLLRFLAANVYNLLSAFSASEVCFYCNEETETLSRRIPPLFEHSGGFGKVCSIARRIYGSFSFRFLPMDEYRAGNAPCTSSGSVLAESLRRRIEASGKRACVGIDVGGSDIKLAVSCKGKLLYTKEYDWNPAASATAEGIIDPILALIREARERIEQNGASLDAVGISFPDIVIDDRIVGGETPKTKGMRENRLLDYEAEFEKLRDLKARILPLCAPGASVRLTNDGNMAAFTAAAELAAGGEDAAIGRGVIAHSLGTDLGTGWLEADGTIPSFPLEMYDLLLDLGNYPAGALPAADLRSTRNENSGMPGVRRYLGQAAAYRLAWKLDPGLLRGFVKKDGEILTIPTAPEDLRKPCLEHLMRLAAEGNQDAEEIFRIIGTNLSVVACEMSWLFGETPPLRFLFGRFVKSRRCFDLISDGFERGESGIRLVAADDALANTPLMRQLAQSPGVTVAQFAQAIGAIYFATE